MGMRGLGQVAALCSVARPTLVVVPHVGPEHLELLGTVERVAEANAEAIAALPSGGVAVVPAAGPLDRFLTRQDVVFRRFAADDVETVDGSTRFSVNGVLVELELPFTQRHLALNTLAALHAYAALGLPLERAAEGVAFIALSPWRGDETELPGGGFVVNDAYNANPDSMRAALVHLAERSASYHGEIGELAADLGIDVIGVGESARRYAPTIWVESAPAVPEAAREYLRPGDAVLVKASRAVGLEGIADEIANFARAWSPY
jgi:UDP-N-acetylmuramoyl-tripeptide--D-alanyl-D-alanine ligase